MTEHADRICKLWEGAENVDEATVHKSAIAAGFVLITLLEARTSGFKPGDVALPFEGDPGEFVYIVKGSQPNVEFRIPQNFHLDGYGSLTEGRRFSSTDKLLVQYHGAMDQSVVGYRVQT